MIASNTCFSDTLEQTLVINETTNPTDKNDIFIYPNPTNNKFTLETKNEVNSLVLYNILGERILKKSNLSAGKHQFNIEHLTAGIHLLKIEVEKEIINILILKE